MMDKKVGARTISKNKTKEFEVLVKDNMKRAYFSALGFLGSPDAAMDVSQEAFIRAYHNFNKYDEKRNFFTWYYKILRNLCLNFIRDTKNRKEEFFLDSRKYEDSRSNPEQNLEEKEELEMLHVAINQLETEDREIIFLREFEGYSYEEISEMLILPAGTVMSRLFYARKKLAEKMKRLME
ncbi:MAG: sigma-70 family RNA polymerase sigma factor [Ignavibacteriaceae bacterium]|jgi:RNA polymerase sigma-70 factor (ECF subfamily)